MFVCFYEMSPRVLHKAWFIHTFREKVSIMERHINTSDCGTLSPFS